MAEIYSSQWSALAHRDLSGRAGGGAIARSARACFFIAMLGASSALPNAAFAQTAAAADSKTIQSCLDRSKSSSEQALQACIGAVANSCMAAANRDPDKSRDQNKEKICFERELAVWKAQLDAALRRIRSGGFQELADAVKRSQDTWQASRNALCPMFNKVDTSMGDGGAAYCAMRETAGRTLLLRLLAEAIEEH
jgi:hypothetical protein